MKSDSVRSFFLA